MKPNSMEEELLYWKGLAHTYAAKLVEYDNATDEMALLYGVPPLETVSADAPGYALPLLKMLLKKPVRKSWRKNG